MTILCLVTDRRLVPDLVPAVAEAVAGGVGLVQVREKDLPAGELRALVERLRAAIAGRAQLVVNDRLDVALVAGAAGVHLPENGLPVEAARRLLGPDRLVGVSVHTAEAAAAAARAGASYLILGTIFPSRSHPAGPAAGPALVARARAATTCPLIAIGGITRDNVAEVIQAGADGVAVISAILAHPDPRAAAAELLAAMTDARSTFDVRRSIPDPQLGTANCELRTPDRYAHSDHQW